MPSKKSDPAWRREMERRFYLEVIDLVKTFPSALPAMTVSEWAERKRILPPSVTPMPGPFRWDVAPYMREIADCFSESSPVQKVAVMKAAQVAFTTAVLENVIGYIIAAAPGPAMFISADKGIAEASVELRIDAMIESAGLGERIFAQTEKAHNKKTGDTKARKDFAGGFLMAVGPRVGSKLRSFPIRYLLGDELDAWPEQIGSTSEDGKVAGEGDPRVLAEKRTAAFERIRKILYGSTPLVEHSSKIYQLFKEGDQRYYHVPCRHCGAMQPLRWKQLKYEAHEDILAIDSVHYECEACGKSWKNADKAWFLPRGEWRPTAEAREPYSRSYHISALYSPVGMRTWEDICLEWVKVKDDPLALRAFVNTVLGEVWQEKGEVPKTEKVMAQIETGEYHLVEGRVPTLPATARPLLVTVGADVQADRIEAEIVAWGIGFESWSLAYLTLDGETDRQDSRAWQALRTALMERHAGMPVDFALVDCGYNTDTVYDFCAALNNVLPVKGDPGLAEDKSSKSKVLRLSDVRERGIQRADVNVDYFKGEIYSHIKRGTETGETPVEPFPGFCHFPAEYSRRYANMLTAERRVLQPRGRTGRSSLVWKQQGRNEALDCFDAETEVLTDQGWKRFSLLNHRERLATVQLETETIEFQKPTHYIERDYSGDMIHIHGRRIDILVTPNHRMVAIRRRQERQSDGSRKWNLNPKPEIVLAKELTIHDQLLGAASWRGKDVRRITIPAYASSQGRVVWPEIEVDSGDLAEFLGWFVSEGCTFMGEANTQPGSIRRRVQIDQNEGPKADMIRSILARLPWPFREGRSRTSVRWTCTNAQLYEAVIRCGIGVENKRVPQWIKDASPDIIKRFLDAAILGDGWKQEKPGQRTFRTYATTSRRLADDIQELFIKLGKAANIREIAPKPIYRGRAISVGRGDLFGCARKQYHVSECHVRKISLDGGGNGKRGFIGQSVHYSGKVYCATVPNGTLILRRNGRSFIAGNCRVYALAALYVMFRYRADQLEQWYREKGAQQFPRYTWPEFWDFIMGLKNAK